MGTNRVGAGFCCASIIIWTLGVQQLRAQQPAAGSNSPRPPRVVAPSTAVPEPAAGPPGRIAGRVLDAATGKPVAGVRVFVVGQSGSAETDLDGRYRSAPLAAGTYVVRAVLIGFSPVQAQNVVVAAGAATDLTLAIKAAALQLDEVVAKADAPVKASSEAGLLAEQKNAAALSDGISAEVISRSPDKDAQGAVTRVTGISVVDDKVVVRGLAERYSNTVLNGVEVSSPDPDKKFVPLDIFPASLLEALVATKTATPDRPGNFAGGSLDIKTREFPDNRVLSFSVSSSANSQSTFKSFALPPRGGTDFIALDDGRRAFPVYGGDPVRFAQAFRNVWTPAPAKAYPNTSYDFAWGGRVDLGRDAFGYVVSANYSRSREFNPSIFSGLGSGVYTYQSANVGVELGGIANFTYRLGGRSKIGWKNFYTRSGTDYVYQGAGTPGDIDGFAKVYQMNYRERSVWQTQLAGEFLIDAPVRARIEVRGTYGGASNDDLDNRQLTYLLTPGDDFYTISARIPNYRSQLRLRDKTRSGQVDVGFPLSLRSAEDGQFKVGGLVQDRTRNFQGESYGISAGGQPRDVLSLPPEQLLAPENQVLYGGGQNALFPYFGKETIAAGYGMVDVELLPRLRLVGGVRYESWKSTIDPAKSINDSLSATTRKQADWLWSGNLTYALSERANLRFAASRTVARPELRELAASGYVPLVGGFLEYGNPKLVRSTVLNGDVRLEVYPGGGDIFAVSGFYKKFTDPLITRVVFAGENVLQPDNAQRAYVYGVELEARKRLGALAQVLSNFSIGANVTLVRSRIRFPADGSKGVYRDDLQFQGQSPYILNFSLSYQSEHPRISFAGLFNRFGSRVARYGLQSGTAQAPNLQELARSTVDAKVRIGVTRNLSFSASGRNLTDALVIEREDALSGPAATMLVVGRRTRYGRTFTLGATYDF